MSQMTGSEFRDQVLAEAQAAYEAQQQAAQQSDPSTPSPQAQRATRMLVDAFGPAAVADPTPTMEQLHTQLVAVQNGQHHVRSLLERNGITPRRFKMVREWEQDAENVRVQELRTGDVDRK